MVAFSLHSLANIFGSRTSTVQAYREIGATQREDVKAAQPLIESSKIGRIVPLKCVGTELNLD